MTSTCHCHERQLDFEKLRHRTMSPWLIFNSVYLCANNLMEPNSISSTFKSPILISGLRRGRGTSLKQIPGSPSQVPKHGYNARKIPASDHVSLPVGRLADLAMQGAVSKIGSQFPFRVVPLSSPQQQASADEVATPSLGYLTRTKHRTTANLLQEFQHVSFQPTTSLLNHWNMRREFSPCDPSTDHPMASKIKIPRLVSFPLFFPPVPTVSLLSSHLVQTRLIKKRKQNLANVSLLAQRLLQKSHSLTYSTSYTLTQIWTYRYLVYS